MSFKNFFQKIEKTIDDVIFSVSVSNFSGLGLEAKNEIETVLVSEKFCGLGRVGLDYSPGFYMLILVPLHFWLVPPHFICSGNGTASGPAPRGAFRSCAFPNKNCASLSEDCVPKKVTGLVPMECSSRLRPQNTDHHPRIREQETFFRRFCGEDLFFVCWSSLTNSRERSFCASQKMIYASPVTLLWRQTFRFLSLFVALVGTIDADVTRGESG